jgi:ATP-dependent Clp protease adaptor protein ClpS
MLRCPYLRHRRIEPTNWSRKAVRTLVAMTEGLTLILTQSLAMQGMTQFGMTQSGLTMAGKGRPGGPDRGGDDGRTDLVTKTRPKTKKPSLYKVLLLNDDYTPMEFVVLVLEKFFGKNHDEAYHVMMHVHQKGVGVCGVFTYEVAETKVTQVMDFARQNGHPLQCTMEKE